MPDFVRKPSFPRRPPGLFLRSVLLALLLPAALTCLAAQPMSSPGASAGAAKAAAPAAVVSTPVVRAVALVAPKTENWPDQIDAQGNVMPWQETRIGTEIGGLRLVSLLANVGDVVKKGQVLAKLNPATVEIDLESANAQLMEAQAAQAQAVATLERAKRLAPTGGVSQQDLMQYETQKNTTEARLNAARAQVKTQQLRLEAATLVAPDDGIISSRSVSEGAIVQAGSELFKLIRQGRLEWRAEVSGENLIKVAVGQEATIKSPLGIEVKGRVRQVSPTIDLTTRYGLIYVDLPVETNFKAGLQVSGTLTLSKHKVLTVPSAAIRRSGEERVVFTVNADNRVSAVKVAVGQIRDGRAEITSGLSENTRIVARVPEALKDGDAVEIGDDSA